MATTDGLAVASDKEAIRKEPCIRSVAKSVDAGEMLKDFGANKTGDIAEGLYREIDSFDPAELESEMQKVRKLIDWRIMPIVSLYYLMVSQVLTASRYVSPTRYSFWTSYP